MATTRKAAPAAKTPAAPVGMKIREGAILRAAHDEHAPVRPFTLPAAPAGVLPKGHKGMAADSAIGSAYAFANIGAAYAEGLQFLGYPYLAELTQRAEYRRPAEILAKHMTRKWIRLQSKGDDGDDKTEKLAAIEEEMKRLNVQGVFKKAAELDGYFGRSQIYLDTGVDRRTDADELKTPLALTPNKIGRDSLERLVVVEPLWTYPNQFDAMDPLSENFYKPKSWFVMGKEIHASRLLTITGRPVPDILKPAYMFGGLSLSQIAKPYVDNWLRTRQSVADLLHSFTQFVLKTNMSTMLTGGSADDIVKRAQFFTRTRDNRNLMMVDKDTEELENVSAPLGSLDKLQAQTQEHMSAVTGIPLSILLGITPSGLNASTEGEIRQFYDWIEAQQEGTLSAPLTFILQVIQLSKFGEIDPDIGFIWEPLWSMDAKQLSELRKSDADADAVYIQNGVISPHESRKRLAADEDSPYASLDLDDDPPPPQPEAEGSPEGEEPSDADRPGAADGEFKEGDHPRGEAGKFGSGGGGASSGAGKPVTLSGDELGSFSTMKELRQKALDYASRFIGKKFTNAATGNQIEVTKTGIRHTIQGSSDGLVRSIPAIPDLLQSASLTNSSEDKGGDPNILAVETYEAPLVMEGEQHRAILTVKKYRDGRRFYDHGLVK